MWVRFVWYGRGRARGGLGRWAHGRPVGSKAPTARSLEPPMRATTLLNRVLDLAGVRVTGVELGAARSGGPVVIDVSLRRRVLTCSLCSFTTSARYDLR